MKRIKKLLSSILTASMLISTVASVNVSAKITKPDEVIDFFTTFRGYEKVFGENTGYPKGAMSADYAYKCMGLFSKADENAGSTKLMIGSSNHTNSLCYPFGETISSGILHISFDLAVPSDYNNAMFIYLHNSDENDLPTDFTTSVNSDGKAIFIAEERLFKVGGDSEGFAAGSNIIIGPSTDFHSTENKITDTVSDYAGKYGKFDIYMDMDEKTVSYYRNGQLLYSGTKIKSDGYKAISFAQKVDNNTNYEIGIDNLYIHHDNNPEDDEIKMIADFAKDGVDVNNAYVDIAFSESLGYNSDDNEPFETDFVLEGGNGNITAAQIIDGNIRLSLSGLEAGKTYTVKLADEVKTDDFYKGRDEKQVNSEATFYTVKTKQPTDRRYYVNEDFESYTGGLPTGTTNVSGNTTPTGNESKVTGKDSNGAIQLKDARACWEFDEAIQSGKYTVEFDVNQDGNWSINLLNGDSFMPDGYILESELESETRSKLWQIRNKNFAIGNSTGDGDQYEEQKQNLYYAKKKIGWNDGYHTFGKIIPLNTWTHVKLVVDLDACTYTVYINEDEQGIVREYNKDRNQLIKVINPETGVRDIQTGAKGIMLYGGNVETPAQFDNLEVYTEKSYNLYEDYDSISKWTDKTYQQGWYSAENLFATNVSSSDGSTAGNNEIRLWYDDGRNSAQNNTDKALKIVSKRPRIHMRPFEIPVEPGRAFDVEFDIKCSNKAEMDMFAMGLVDANDLYRNSTNTLSNEASKLTNTTNETVATGTTVKLLEYNVCLNNAKVNTKSDTNTAYYLSGIAGNKFNIIDGSRDSSNHNNKEYLDNSVDFKKGTWGVEPTAGQNVTDNSSGTVWCRQDGNGYSGVWHHVKFSYIPKSDGVYFKLKVTYEDGTSQESPEVKSKKSLDDEIAGIFFWNKNHKSDYTKKQYAEGDHVANNIDWTISDILIDNLKVYETGKISAPYVAQAKIVAFDGSEKDIDSGFTTADDYIKLELSENVAEISTDAVSVVNTTDGQSISVNTTLKGNTVEVRFADPTVVNSLIGKEITVTVSAGLTDNMTAYSKTVNVTAATEGIKVSGIRIYKYYPEKTASFGTIAAAYAPMSAEDIDLNNITETDKFKVYLEGYNPGEAESIALFIAKYNGGRLVAAEQITANIQRGTFTLPLTEDISFSSLSGSDSYKIFVWQNGTLKPLADNSAYTITNITTE